MFRKPSKGGRLNSASFGFLLDISISYTAKNVSSNTSKTEITTCETAMSCMVVLSNIA